MFSNLDSPYIATIGSMILVLVGYYLLSQWLMNKGHAERRRQAAAKNWQYTANPSRRVARGWIYRLIGTWPDGLPWELSVRQAGVNKVHLSWYAKRYHLPEGTVIFYPRPSRLMKELPPPFKVPMVSKSIGPKAVPLADGLGEMALGGQLFREHYFVLSVHEAAATKLLTPQIEQILAHWPGNGYKQLPVVSLHQQELRVRSVEPFYISDWPAVERLVELGLKLGRHDG